MLDRCTARILRCPQHRKNAARAAKFPASVARTMQEARHQIQQLITDIDSNDATHAFDDSHSLPGHERRPAPPPRPARRITPRWRTRC
ncbi:hypothetical protein MKCMC460_62410 (plasmid) [Mycobacterium sp. 20KCMC460]|uniref:hypothetical protein n=1 Tax=unclassified Mycobacterium TaxID=2642494 RepID=UPI00216C661C|nr:MULTISPECIES: hypothetical protein [unclassified Mycobacterium]BDE17381.1 hypothetical protein MKCMC460_62410 [Mycobacterium sp. 20KCMC460]GLC04588.1 hypothetical protein SRL2020400_51790 [Mycobacterium kiyosense]MDP7707165.1 hypothetical protein [Mycobacterium sp. TY815]MDP7733035.1 hypothetical protein [Mycobacterium sp. TY813]GLC17066.1 hypothetical protein SRL2020448_56690 [Mycobacterium kiyosense]